jgi:hypothetical protein
LKKRGDSGSSHRGDKPSQSKYHQPEPENQNPNSQAVIFFYQAHVYLLKEKWTKKKYLVFNFLVKA